MSELPDEFFDGFALWQEHKPQTGEDWVRVAERCLSTPPKPENPSPLFDALLQTVAERDEAREELAIAKMERDWLLGAWAAATETPQAEAEAEFLKWSSKWRETARSQPSGSDG